MSSPHSGKKAVVPDALQGEIQSRTMPYLFHDLGTSRATGVLTVAGRTVRKMIHFKAGRMQFASSTDRDDRFNQTLLRNSVISLRDVLRALEIALSSRDRLGEVLVRMRILTPAEVEKWVRVQVEEIALSTFDRISGTWRFDPGPIGVEAIGVDLPADALVLDGVRRMRSWARVYEEVGGLNAEYLATRDVEAVAKDLPIEEGEKSLLAMCRTPTALGEMCESSEMGDIDVCRSVWALLSVGALIKS
ncbi:MAG TPA: DUF4388 domain-containing protein [Dongiaceae bacterium]|nr:DUF4388 domain-containing protein [Dongiaceae bacterium]